MGKMNQDPREILQDQLLASELSRKEKQIAAIKSLPFGLGFYSLASLVLITTIVGLSAKFDLHMILFFLVSCLLLLLNVISNIRVHQKITTLLDLIGEEKLRKLSYKSDESEDSEALEEGRRFRDY